MRPLYIFGFPPPPPPALLSLYQYCSVEIYSVGDIDGITTLKDPSVRGDTVTG